MKQGPITLANILTYSGTLPLIVSIYLGYFPSPEFNSSLIAKTYSAIIVSFLCGIHWAIYLFFADKCPNNLLITSNVIALLAWASLAVTFPKITILLHSFCFIYLLTLDLKLRDADILPIWFYDLRRNATIIVLLCFSILVGLS
ncbi:MAG: DUF3429 domain-containing protein [Alphaproteobacteria bacterium]|jgi:hypothetical protein